MIAASEPVQPPAGAKLLSVDGRGEIHHANRAALIEFLHPGDLVIANDAATMPASLAGIHERTGETIEVRLTGRQSLDLADVAEFRAIVFGAGDYRTRTEDRPAPPRLAPGDRLALGPLA